MHFWITMNSACNKYLERLRSLLLGPYIIIIKQGGPKTPKSTFLAGPKSGLKVIITLSIF
jgi:hypothetical protein